MKEVILLVGMLGILSINAQSTKILKDENNLNCPCEITRFYENTNTIRETGCFDKDLKERRGDWSLYSKEGILLSTASFDLNGRKHGIWKTQNREGEKIAIMFYEHGERVGTWEMYENNILVSTKTYK